MSGKDGTLETFKELNIKRKIFIHINTTNPALLENSEERKIVDNFGWEIARDNMEILL
jgi:pyrroloquinoline quinone biosynthesis protein B